MTKNGIVESMKRKTTLQHGIVFRKLARSDIDLYSETNDIRSVAKLHLAPHANIHSTFQTLIYVHLLYEIKQKSSWAGIDVYLARMSVYEAMSDCEKYRKRV